MRRRLREIEVPRGAVIVICALLLAPPAAISLGHSLWNSAGGWVHHHTRTYTTCNYIDQDADLRAQAWIAKANWATVTQSAEHPDGAVSFPGDNQTLCHVGEGAPEATHVQLQDAYFGNTGWRASAVNDPDAPNNAAYHARHTHVSFNLTYIDALLEPMDDYDKRALVCRELGRVAGVSIVPLAQIPAEGQANDCMSFRGTGTEVSFAEDPVNYTYTSQPGAHSKALIDETYAAHDSQIELDDPTTNADLYELATQGVPLAPAQSYSLRISATDGPQSQPPPGVRSLEVRVDGVRAYYQTQACAAGGCPMSRTWTMDTALYGNGSHEIEVIAVDQLDLATSKSFTATIDKQAPDTVITSGPTATNDPPSFAFSGSPEGDVHHFECKLNSNGYSPCTSPKSYSALADGTHAFRVRGVDGFGNADPSPALHSFRMDSVAPGLNVSGFGAEQVPLSSISDPVVGNAPEFGVRATDPNSGAVTVRLIVDGQPLDTITAPCPEGSCEIEGSLVPDLSEHAAGLHSYIVLARDAATNETRQTGTFTLDPTPPELAVSGALVDSESGPLLAEGANATISATDGAVGDSGVAKLEVTVDDEVAATKELTCAPSCPGSAGMSFTYRKSDWGPGPHSLTITATDEAGNSRQTDLEIDVPDEPADAVCPGDEPTVQSAVNPVDAAQAQASALPSAIAPSQPAYDVESDSEIDPSLSRPDDSPPTPLDVIGGLADASIATAATQGFSVDGILCLVPTQTTSAETHATIVNGDSSLYANTASETDTIVRPTAAGMTLIDILRGLTSPSTFAWDVGLQEGLEARPLSDGGIAIVDPLQPPGDAEVPTQPVGAGDPLSIPNVAVQLAEGEYRIAKAEQETGVSVAAVIAPGCLVGLSTLSCEETLRLELEPGPSTAGGRTIGRFRFRANRRNRGRAAAIAVFVNRTRKAPQPLPAWYMNVTNFHDLKQEASINGCKFASKQTGSRRVMLFDFGKAKRAGNGQYGVELRNGPFFDNHQVVTALKNAADSYAGLCYQRGRALITYGTTNNVPESMSGAEVREAGVRLANKTHTVRNYQQRHGIIEGPPYYEREGVAMASDVEPVWSTPGRARTYVDAAKNAFGVRFINYGNAAGCPPGLGCIGGWSVGDIGWISFAGNDYAMPEIYTEFEAKQWANIRDVAGGRQRFGGVTGSNLHSSLSPRESWMKLHRKTKRVGRDLVDIGNTR